MNNRWIPGVVLNVRLTIVRHHKLNVRSIQSQGAYVIRIDKPRPARCGCSLTAKPEKALSQSKTGRQTVRGCWIRSARDKLTDVDQRTLETDLVVLPAIECAADDEPIVGGVRCKVRRRECKRWEREGTSITRDNVTGGGRIGHAPELFTDRNVFDGGDQAVSAREVMVKHRAVMRPGGGQCANDKGRTDS